MEQRKRRNDKAIEALIDTLYDTAVADTRDCAWCGVLPKMCDAFDASAGCFVVHDFAARSGALRHRYNIRPEFKIAYNTRLAALNPWMDSLTFYNEGSVVSGRDILSDDDMVRTEFYFRYLEPQDLLHRLCGVISQDGGETHYISLMRPPGAGPFSGADKAILSTLLPHLKRSVKVRTEVMRDRWGRVRLAEFMDHLPIGFLLVGGDGHVELINRAAREMIDQVSGLFVGAGGYLATASAKNTANLRQLIGDVANGRPGLCNGDGGEHFVISRGPDRLPLICVLYRIAPALSDDQEEANAAVAIMVKDPQQENHDGLAALVREYGLTNAEARLIELLAVGHGVFEAAAELGITKNTVRTHMRHIYSKVGMHRQADLMHLFDQFCLF